MSSLTLAHSGATTQFTSASAFVAALEKVLPSNQVIVATIPFAWTRAWKLFNDLLAAKNLEIKLTDDSDPEVVDYVLNSLGAGALGAAAVTATTAAGLVVAARAGQALPAAGLILLAGAAIGLVGGLITGAFVTRAGLRIRLTQINSENAKVELLPAA